MKKFCFSLAMAAAVLMTASANADTFTIDANVDSVDNQIVFEQSFDLGDVESIKSISVDFAHTWGGDIVATLTNDANGTTYELLNGDTDQSGSNNFDLGVVAGDASLANVATYEFVESGGLTVFDDTSGVAPGGTYDANIWGSGGSGLWTFTVDDTAGGDPTSIGQIVIDFNTTAIPEPTSGLIVLGLAGIAGIRRRR